MKIYTKTGDKGETGLRGGRRLPKSSPKVAAYGDVDEVNSAVGVAISLLPKRKVFTPLQRALGRIQNELFHLGAVLASERDHEDCKNFPAGLPQWLEGEIDRMEKDLPALKQFILPGGSQPGAALHAARSVCRRAERSVVGLPAGEAPEGVVVYLNRLSDYLFACARWVNARLKRREVPWPGLK